MRTPSQSSRTLYLTAKLNFYLPCFNRPNPPMRLIEFRAQTRTLCVLLRCSSQLLVDGAVAVGDGGGRGGRPAVDAPRHVADPTEQLPRLRTRTRTR
eukprot:4972076-Pleurochrysis_carterae.AAC.2